MSDESDSGDDGYGKKGKRVKKKGKQIVNGKGRVMKKRDKVQEVNKIEEKKKKKNEEASHSKSPSIDDSFRVPLIDDHKIVKRGNLPPIVNEDQKEEEEEEEAKQ